MYACELQEQKKRQRKLERLLAVRQTEKQRAREVRERAVTAKENQEREAAEGMRATWAIEQQKLIKKTADNYKTYKSESEGSAHRNAHQLTQQNRELGATSCTAWDQRDTVHDAFYKNAFRANSDVRAIKLSRENSLRSRREHVHAIEAKRAREVVEVQKNTPAIKIAREPQFYQPGLHSVKNVVSDKWQVDDYKSTGYHKLLTSKTAQLYPADGGRAQVWRNVGAAEQGVVRAGDIAEQVAAASSRARQEEKQKLAEFAAKERERATAVRRLQQKEDEEEALVEEVASAERQQRRKKISSLSTDCRFVEHQQTEMRKTQALEKKLKHDFERAFIRPDLNWELNSRGKYPSSGNDTRVIAADASDNLPHIISSSVEVSQHLKELFEIQRQQPALCEPAVLSHYTVGNNEEKEEEEEEPADDEQVECEVKQSPQISTSSTQIVTPVEEEVITLPTAVEDIQKVESEQPASSQSECEPTQPQQNIVKTEHVSTNNPLPIQTEATDLHTDSFSDEYQTPERPVRKNSFEEEETAVSSPDQISSTSLKEPKDAISVASHNMALLQVNIAGLQDRLKQLLELPPSTQRHNDTTLTPSKLSNSSSLTTSSETSPSSNGPTLSSSSTSEISTPGSVNNYRQKRHPVIVNVPRRIPRANVASDGWIRGGYSPSPSRSTTTAKSSSITCSSTTGDISTTVLNELCSSTEGSSFT